jgi:16S rRNA (guanine966-N2)-methyltransferase
MANNELRIIGGQWKGRKLRFPERPALRPTLGRVRETLFNWLAPTIAGARCLDLFAGSGALGFEALSRGAAEVTFVERDRKAARALASNIELLSANASVACLTARQFLERPTGTYRIVFLDPPFDAGSQDHLIGELLERHVEPEGMVYLEQPKRASLPAGVEIFKESTAGDCRFALLRAPGEPTP